MQINDKVARDWYEKEAIGRKEMRMIIKSIESNDAYTYVIGDTNIGSIKGVWRYKEAPIVDKVYFFELNIADFDGREISVIHEGKQSPRVCYKDNEVSFKGICEEIDDIYVVRFAEDWIEMISIENDDFTIQKGDWISFSVSCDSVLIYPYTFE